MRVLFLRWRNGYEYELVRQQVIERYLMTSVLATGLAPAGGWKASRLVP